MLGANALQILSIDKENHHNASSFDHARSTSHPRAMRNKKGDCVSKTV